MGKTKFSRDDYFDAAMDDYPTYAKVMLVILVCLAGAIGKILWFWHIDDGEKLKGSDGCHVIIMNHVSFLETVIPSVYAWLRGHHVRPMYKSEFEDNPILGWLLPRIGGIPVDRGTADMKAVKRAVACLRRGESILIFPEGGRVRDEANRPEPHNGYALIARMAKAPVLPMAVCGIKTIKATNGNLIWPFVPVRFKVGDSLRYEDFHGVGSRRQQTEALGRAGMERVYAMHDGTGEVTDSALDEEASDI